MMKYTFVLISPTQGQGSLKSHSKSFRKVLKSYLKAELNMHDN